MSTIYMHRLVQDDTLLDKVDRLQKRLDLTISEDSILALIEGRWNSLFREVREKRNLDLRTTMHVLLLERILRRERVEVEPL